MAREVSLKQRVRAILDDATDRRPVRSAGVVAILVAALSLYLPLTVVRGSAPEMAVAAVRLPTVGAVIAGPAEGQPSYLWLEAESGIRDRTTDAYAGLDASNAEYLLISPAAGPVSIETVLSAAAEYFVWVRVSSRDSEPSALTVSIDGSTPWSLRVPVGSAQAGSDWRWLRITDGGVDAAEPSKGVLLPAGDHRFELSATGDDLGVDRVLVTTNPTFTPAEKGPAASGSRTYLLLEGEEGLRHGRIRDGRDSHASGSSFVVFREGRRATPAGMVEFSFDVPTAGRYLIWGRTYAQDEESNSFHLSLDDQQEMIWDLPAADERDEGLLWAWDPVSARAGEDRTIDPVPFDLESGSHQLRIRTREGGAHLDALLITSDLENRPDGLWPEALPTRPARLELAAEAARLSGPIELKSDSAEGPAYLAVDEEGRARSPGASGLAAFEFEATETGLYSVWARTVAPSSDQDSFWIRVNGGEWTLWNGIPRSSEWTWAPVRDADAEGRLLQIRLRPGRHTLEIAGREGGLRLGRLLVTNDPLFKPS